MATGWDDLDLRGGDGSYTTSISPSWELAVVPQGGIVAALAVRAMERELGDATQSLRTMTVLFAGQVAAGPVEIDVALLRRGRSMSQLTATVRNRGAEAGLTAIAAFGAPRRGFDFTELVMPDVAGPETLLGFRDPIPDGIDFDLRLSAAAVLGRDRGEPTRHRAGAVGGVRGRAGRVGQLVPLRRPPAPPRRQPRPGRRRGPVRHDAGLGRPEARPRQRAVVRAERRLHAPPVPGRPARSGCSLTTRPATPATATPASTPRSGTRPAPTSSPTPPSSWSSASG